MMCTDGTGAEEYKLEVSYNNLDGREKRTVASADCIEVFLLAVEVLCFV